MFAVVLILAWAYVILKCKEKTSPAMDNCAKWIGGLLFLAFCAFIIFCMVFLITGDKISFRKDKLEEDRQNLEEILKYCDGHPNVKEVLGVDWETSTCDE